MKVGVIGLGSMGSRHDANLRSLGHQVIGYDPAVRMDLGLERLVYDECEAIVVATPSGFHGGTTRASIERSKHVLVEKPILLASPEVAASLIEDAAKKNVTLMVAYNLRFHGSVIQAKKWLNEGRIGKPIWANFICGQYSDKPAYLRDGVILNWSHEIDLALYLLGDAKVDGSSTRLDNGHDCMTNILMTHEGGCKTSIHLDYFTKPEIRTFTIVGTGGKISVSLPQRNAFLTVPDRDQSDWIHCRRSYDLDYKDEMIAFIDRINGKETLGCTGQEALKVLDICLQVRRQAGMTS